MAVKILLASFIPKTAHKESLDEFQYYGVSSPYIVVTTIDNGTHLRRERKCIRDAPSKQLGTILGQVTRLLITIWPLEKRRE